MNEWLSSVQTMFLEAQHRHLWHWLLNWQLYAAVAVLLLATWLWPAQPRSSRTAASLSMDYTYGLVHTALVFPLLAVATVLVGWMIDARVPWLRLNLYAEIPAAAQVIVAIVITDASKFLSHVLHHRLRPLWHFHTIHHSQQTLNPFTTKRVHIGEKLVSTVCIGAPLLALMGSQPEVWLAYYLIDAVWDYFIHSNLRIDFGPLRYVFVSPLYHRLHHSTQPRHFDKNFADRFVIWDLLYGSADFDYRGLSDTGVPDSPIVHERRWSPDHLLAVYWQQFLHPFRMIARDVQTGRVEAATKGVPLNDAHTSERPDPVPLPTGLVV